MITRLFRLVTTDAAGQMDVQELQAVSDSPGGFTTLVQPFFEVRGYPVTGDHHSPHTRRELQGMPTFEGLLGPFYDGDRGGVPAIRYECQTTYDILSR